MTVVRSALVALGGLVAVGVVASAVVAYLTFGVQQSSPSDTRTSASGIIASSENSADAPAVFKDRPDFRSCGRIILKQGGRIPPARVACLASTPTEGRELIVVVRTAEGDPVVRYYRTGPDIEGVEIFEDSTSDRFSNGGWHRSVCRSGQIDQSGACV